MDENISIIIVEDEFHDSEILKIFLNEIGNVNIISIADDEDKAFREILTKQPDLVFFDINLNGKPAFNVLQDLKKADIRSQIVFTTAYEGYAAKVFEYSNQKYLLKPIDKKELREVIDCFRKNHTKKSTIFENLDFFETIKFKDSKSIIYLSPKDIFFCIADGRYTKIYTTKNDFHLVTSNLKEIEEKLFRFKILRIHKSSLINMIYLKRYENQKESVLIEKNGENILLKVARTYKNIFM